MMVEINDPNTRFPVLRYSQNSIGAASDLTVEYREDDFDGDGNLSVQGYNRVISRAEEMISGRPNALCRVRIYWGRHDSIIVDRDGIRQAPDGFPIRLG